jgi:outer membrane protein OmpA-like peptidoglycan-associated protein
VQLQIEGYTDKGGDADADRRLSLQRANAMKDLLVKAGVPADRISTEGFGPDKPIAPNDSDENRAKNRRIEFTLVRK